MASLWSDVRFHASLVATIVIVLLVALLAWHDLLPSLSYILVLFLSGALGGVINTYVRLRRLARKDYDSEYDDRAWRRLAIIQTYVSPLISGALGFVFYGFLVSGVLAALLQPDLLPKFDCLGDAFAGVLELMRCVRPSSNADAAKALFWAFVGGFSEYLVPNILDQVRPAPPG